jgi:hypothetical protein
MPTSPVKEPPTGDNQTEDVLSEAALLEALEALDDPEDREDLVIHVKALKKLKEGKDQLIPWDEALKQLGS